MMTERKNDINRIRLKLAEMDGVDKLIRNTILQLCDELEITRSNVQSYAREAHNRAFQQKSCPNKCSLGPFDKENPYND
jgi:hypothetical protein